MSAFSGAQEILDAQLEPGKPVEEKLATAYPERDDHNKTSNTDGNYDDLASKYNPGHGHTGAAGDGPQIKTAGIDDGGIWKSEYIADDAATSGKINNLGVPERALASRACPEPKMDGDSSTGMLFDKDVDSGDILYDPETDETKEYIYTHSQGQYMIPVNLRGFEWVVIDITPNVIKCGPRGRNAATGSFTWRAIFDVL